MLVSSAAAAAVVVQVLGLKIVRNHEHTTAVAEAVVVQDMLAAQAAGGKAVPVTVFKDLAEAVVRYAAVAEAAAELLEAVPVAASGKAGKALQLAPADLGQLYKVLVMYSLHKLERYWDPQANSSQICKSLIRCSIATNLNFNILDNINMHYIALESDSHDNTNRQDKLL